MTATPPPLDLPALYRADETAWLDLSAGLAAAGRADRLDLVSLAEFLTSMANRDRRAVVSRLEVLLAHLLKWHFQPAKRTRSWSTTVITQRNRLADLLESGTLTNYAVEMLPVAYARAVEIACSETGLPTETFPAACPYTLAEATAPGFLPAAPDPTGGAA